MIEIIQQTERKEEDVENKLPKNIRQIGNPEKDFRIYMEDYVYTYLHPAQINGGEIGVLPRLLILLGEINHFSNRSCAFISGAIRVEGTSLSEEIPTFNEKIWRQIHKEMQQFFGQCEIVGWVLDIPGNTLEVTREMEELHRRNFVSPYQFFFLMDSREREEAFYTWKDGRLTRKEGYFIYYEKNPQMQEYMISQREALYGETHFVEEVEDLATKNYRALMLEKKERTYKRRVGFLSYLTSLLMVFILCFVCIILVGNIQRMENMEQTISTISFAKEPTEPHVGTEAVEVQVETVKSDVKKIMEKEEGITTEQVETETLASQAEVMSQAETTPQVETTSEAGEVKALDVSEEPETEQPVMSEEAAYLAQGYYIVRAGDSLQEICLKVYQTDAMLDTLCKENQIDDKDTIYVGQKILLP